MKADIEGWGKPDTIGGVRPDIIAEKSGHKTVVEVETKESVDSKRDQQHTKGLSRIGATTATRNITSGS